jgi:hypothetical protein
MKLFTALIFCSLSLSVWSQSRVQILKNDILSLSRQFQGQEDRDGSKQAALESMVAELENLIEPLSMDQKAKKIIGEWRQVFGPYSEKADGTITPGMVTEHIYQTIFPNGTYYNVALVKLAGVKSVILLKGEFEVLPQAIKAEFTRQSLLWRKVPTENFSKLPALLEAGKLQVTHLPNRLPPVGQGGELLEVYADDTLRILRGTSPSYTKTALLIMEKVK